MKDFLNADGFTVFTDVVKTSDLTRKHPDLIQGTLKGLRYPLTAIKYIVRNEADPNVFVRDVYFLEVTLPLVSCILALKAMEIEFVLGSQQWISSQHGIIEQTPLRVPQTMIRLGPTRRVQLEPGHLLVYNGALVYRNCTADASYLHIPGCIETTRKDLLSQIAHVPAILAVPDWIRIVPRKIFGAIPPIERWASRFVVEFGVTETQRAEFYRKYSYSTLVPEYGFIRLNNNPSNTPNRVTFFENPQKFTTFNSEQTVAFEQVFFTRPYWFLLVSMLFWIVMMILLILYGLRLWQRRSTDVVTLPASPTTTKMCPCRTPRNTVARSKRSTSVRPPPPAIRSVRPPPPAIRSVSKPRFALRPRSRSAGTRPSTQQIVIKVMSRP